MSKHIVFFVHGMGRHDATWHRPALNVLTGAFTQYESYQGKSLDDRIEAVPVIYDDRIEVWRTRMAADFKAFRGALLGDLADGGSRTQIERQLDRLEGWIGAGEDPGFAWTHAADVLLYRWMSTLRMAIDVAVAARILARLQEGGFSGWSILAHSLGTSVTHNVLNMLYAGFGDQPPLDPSTTRPRVVLMVANVSRVLQRPGAKVLQTRVRPGYPSTGALCAYYLNARHRLDPFVYPKPFMPDLWPEPGSFSSSAYQHLQPSHIHFSKDALFRVHDVDHYLVNPRVHVPLFRALFGESTIGEAEFSKAKTQFDSAIVSPNIDAARDRLESMLPAPSGGWQMLLGLCKRIAA